VPTNNYSKITFKSDVQFLEIKTQSSLTPPAVFQLLVGEHRNKFYGQKMQDQKMQD